MQQLAVGFWLLAHWRGEHLKIIASPATVCLQGDKNVGLILLQGLGRGFL